MKKKIWRIAFAIAALVMAAGFNRIDVKAAADGTSFEDAVEVKFGDEHSKSYTRRTSQDRFIVNTVYYEGIYYKFNVPSSGLVSFSGQASYKGVGIGDEYVSLYNAKQEEVLHTTNTEKGVSERWYLLAGDYYLRFQGSDWPDSTTTHEFALSYTDTKETFGESQNKNNNTILKASEFVLGDEKFKTIRGQLGNNDKMDCYKFAVPSSGKVSFDISSNAYAISFALYDESGREMHNDSGAGYVSTAFDLIKGTYYISVGTGSLYDFNYYGTYAVESEFVSAGESFEESGNGRNNSVNTASEIKLDTEYAGQIAMNDADDYYKVTVPAGGILEISGTSTSLACVNVALYSADGTKLTNKYYDINTAGVNNFVLERECTAGTYYVDLSKWSDKTGNYTFSVKVKPIPVSKIVLNKTRLELAAGQSETLVETVTPENASNKKVTWSSSDATVADVDENGKVTAKKGGTATITATAADGSEISASCTITVKAADGWVSENNVAYWYEGGVKQGTTGRGKEIFDAESQAWYWLDAIQGGAKTVSKDVYQVSDAGIFADNADGTGKWVRYDAQGHMIKGWCAGKAERAHKINAPREAGGEDVYYFDETFGAMVKGTMVLEQNGQKTAYEFDVRTGIKSGEFEVADDFRMFGWNVLNGVPYWFEEGVKQGVFGRGKEICDPATDDWYWLDAVDGGRKAVSKDVYQESLAGDWGEIDNGDGTKSGKWVRYDAQGHMIKGWCAGKDADAVRIDSPDKADGRDVYYFDLTFGTMAKGNAHIDGVDYYFDLETGILQY